VQAPAAEGENVLLDGFAAGEKDEDCFILEHMLQEEGKLEFNANTESIRQTKKLSLAVETELYFMDASNNEFWSSIPTLDDLLLLDSDLVS
jgi:hypothetical protein